MNTIRLRVGAAILMALGFAGCGAGSYGGGDSGSFSLDVFSPGPAYYVGGVGYDYVFAPVDVVDTGVVVDTIDYVDSGNYVDVYSGYDESYYYDGGYYYDDGYGYDDPYAP